MLEETAMKLLHCSTADNLETGKITAIHLVIADDLDPAKRKEWIDAQVAVDLPLIRNGAILRREALEIARGHIDQLIQDLRNIEHRVQG
jgi:hypothetical protein